MDFGLSVRSKLLVGFGLVVATMAVIAGIGWWAIVAIASESRHIYADNVQSAVRLAEAERGLWELRFGLPNYLTGDPQAREKIKADTAKWLQQVNASISAYAAVAGTAEEKAALRDWQESYLAYAESRPQFFALVDAGNVAEAQEFRARVTNPAAGRAVAALAKLNEQQQQLAAEKLHAVSATEELSVRLLAVVAAMVVVASVAVLFYLLRSIVAPVRRVAERLEQLRGADIASVAAASAAMARGDLSVRARAETPLLEVSSRDEIGALAGSLNGIVRQTQAMVATFEQAVGTLGTLIGETQSLAKAAQQGQLDARGDASKYQGGYRELVEGMNQLLEAVVAPLNEATAVLERVAARDLTAEMRGDYRGDYARMKAALNTAVGNLDRGLSQVAVGAQQVTAASEQISDGSQSLSQGASAQASTFEEISSSLQELAGMARRNAANAKEAQGLSGAARSSAQKGAESMQRLSEAMDRIKASSDATAKIVKTIDEIAFQTNLLALNAAVEAARAGDAGKGFAVVAEEVRNLAMRSAEAAKNTANLIEGSVRNAGDGVAISDEVLRNLEGITAQVQKVGEVVAEITVASDQQNLGVDQLTSAVEQVSQVTQQTAANAEESASAAEELSGQAAEMLHMVGSFTLSEGGMPSKAVRPVAAPRPARRAPAPVGSTNGAAHARHGDPRHLIPLDDDEAIRDF